MKKMHKRVLALLMALVLMFSCTAFASAATPRYTQSFGPYSSYASDVGQHYYAFTLQEDAYLNASIFTETFIQVRIHKENANGELVYSTGWNPMGTPEDPYHMTLIPYGASSPQKFPAGRYMLEVKFRPTYLRYIFAFVASSSVYYE